MIEREKERESLNASRDKNIFNLLTMMLLLLLFLLILLRLGDTFHFHGSPFSPLPGFKPRCGVTESCTSNKRLTIGTGINKCGYRYHSLILMAKKKKNNAKGSSSLEEHDEVNLNYDASINLEKGTETVGGDEDFADEIPEDKGDRSVNLPEQSKKETVNDIIRAVVQENNAALRKVFTFASFFYLSYDTNRHVYSYICSNIIYHIRTKHQ